MNKVLWLNWSQMVDTWGGLGASAVLLIFEELIFVTNMNCTSEPRTSDLEDVCSPQDYSWEDHGFSLVNRLYSDIGHLLDDRFRSVTTLPSLHSPDLRRAIWNYIHCVLGIR